MTSIYGLFDSRGRCFYVGATISPKRREEQHRAAYGGRLRAFTVFKRVRVYPEAFEGALVREFKAIGQASENRHVRKAGFTFNQISAKLKAMQRGQILCFGRDRERRDAITCARILGITVATKRVKPDAYAVVRIK